MSFRTFELSNPEDLPPGVHFVTVKSAALKRRADITFYVPPGAHAERLPLVTLLHGVYGSHWAWLFKGGAHRVMDRLIKNEALPPMMLAMPSDGLWGDGSGYLRHAQADYVKWIMEEVPAAAAMVEPKSASGLQFIGGLSMGGYGALRLGALFPERFAAISGHSSVTDIAQLQGFVEEQTDQYELAEAHPLPVLDCLKQNAHRLPPLRFDCGTEDHLIEPNRLLHQELTLAGIEHVFEEFPGAHAWDYWHEHLADSLRFFGAHAQNKAS
jgi:enterochelin esterase-like enzyme